MFDKHKISSEQIKLMKERFNLENSFVLGYVGSIDVAYMIEEMFDCFKIMKQYIENAKFLMVVNNGKNAGQIVGHVHLHVLPRKEGDGFIVSV